RMDARIAGMSAKLDATLAELKADRTRFTQIESDLREMKSEMKSLPERMDSKMQAAVESTENKIKDLKSNIWFGVATTVGAMLAMMALTFSAYDSGRETSKNISEASMRLEKLQTQLESATKAVVSQPTGSGEKIAPVKP